MTILAIVLLLSSLALSACLTAIVRPMAVKCSFVAKPSVERHHQTIVPLGGGIAIFATLAIVIIGAIIVVKFFAGAGHLDWLGESVTVHTEGFLGKINQLIVVLLCIFALFILGLYDDKKHLEPFFKLAVQFAVAIIAAWQGKIRVELFIENEIITSVLSAIWIVLIMNVFNFLDNMDGASAGIAIITSCILFTAAALSGQIFIGGLALVFVGTLSGFLIFNFPPAKIFMGDAGSLVVGFMVGLLTLRTTYYNESASGQWYAVLMPLVVMAVPLYDFISVTLLRLSQGKSPFVGDTQHFSHRLKRRGLSDSQTVLTLYLVTLSTGLGATFLYQVNSIGAVLIFVQTIMVLFIVAILEATAKNNNAQN